MVTDTIPDRSDGQTFAEFAGNDEAVMRLASGWFDQTYSEPLKIPEGIKAMGIENFLQSVARHFRARSAESLRDALVAVHASPTLAHRLAEGAVFDPLMTDPLTSGSGPDSDVPVNMMQSLDQYEPVAMPQGDDGPDIDPIATVMEVLEKEPPGPARDAVFGAIEPVLQAGGDVASEIATLAQTESDPEVSAIYSDILAGLEGEAPVPETGDMAASVGGGKPAAGPPPMPAGDEDLAARLTKGLSSEAMRSVLGAARLERKTAAEISRDMIDAEMLKAWLALSPEQRDAAMAPYVNSEELGAHYGKGGTTEDLDTADPAVMDILHGLHGTYGDDFQESPPGRGKEAARAKKKARESHTETLTEEYVRHLTPEAKAQEEASILRTIYDWAKSGKSKEEIRVLFDNRDWMSPYEYQFGKEQIDALEEKKSEESAPCPCANTAARQLGVEKIINEADDIYWKVGKSFLHNDQKILDENKWKKKRPKRGIGEPSREVTNTGDLRKKMAKPKRKKEA